MAKLKIGDRVEHARTQVNGTVEYADDLVVWVRWDDHMLGILGYDPRITANARLLIKLRNTVKSQ